MQILPYYGNTGIINKQQQKCFVKKQPSSVSFQGSENEIYPKEALYGHEWLRIEYYKKKGIMVEIEQPTALKQFLDKNEKIGKKITDEVKTLYAEVYADDSTICKVATNELRVDHGQHMSIYDNVFPLREDINNVIAAHIGFARKNNLFEDSLMKLIVADERMYRAVAYTCLYGDLERLFVEYNKARNEAKGEITPQSNFIQGELLKVVNHIKFMRDNQKATDEETWTVADYVLKSFAEIEKDAAFCPHCGTARTGRVTPPPRDNTKKCPSCGHIIPVESTVCAFCSYSLAGSSKLWGTLVKPSDDDLG